MFFTGFVIVALAQLYIPAKMIYNHEATLSEGEKYKFKLRPIDPSDPVRGKYIVLHFENRTVDRPTGVDWKREETIYLVPTRNDEGYAEIDTFYKEPPEGSVDYFPAKMDGIPYNDSTKMRIEYPFKRYYLKETKARAAEDAYDDARWEAKEDTYAVVYVKDGQAVLKDVKLGGISIDKIVQTQQAN